MEICNQSDIALELELEALRAKRKVVEMTPYGPVLDAPRINKREHCETVLNDPSACLSAKRQARAWLRSNRVHKRPSGSKHHMVRKAKLRRDSYHRYWKEYWRMRLKAFRRDHRQEGVELNKYDLEAIITLARKRFKNNMYIFMRKDTTQPWRWDNVLVAEKWNNENRVDILIELARPEQSLAEHDDLSSKTRSNSPPKGT